MVVVAAGCVCALTGPCVLGALRDDPCKVLLAVESQGIWRGRVAMERPEPSPVTAGSSSSVVCDVGSIQPHPLQL